MTKAATLTGISKAKIANIENGRQMPSPDDITALLSAYGAPQGSINRMIALGERYDEANWWTPWSAVIPPWFSVFVGLERLADHEFAYQPDAFPGLLQTRAYATAVTSESILARADHVERIVEFRQARAARLTDPERPLSLHCVISTWALEIPIGTPEVRREQLKHLVTMAELPTVTIQILRPQDGMHTASGSAAFVLLELDAVSRVGYIELLDDAVYFADRNKLEIYQLGANDLKRVSLNPQQSLEVLRRALSDE